MAIEVFNRHEKKYVFDKDTYIELEKHFMKYMKPDVYNEENYTYPILNIYYDTVKNDLIRTSVSKPRYKEKLRLRAYNIPTLESEVYIEIKKKISGFVNKRRSMFLLNEAYDFLSGKEVDTHGEFMNVQVINEIKYFLSMYKLEPKLYLSYDRRALVGIEQEDLRISYDTNILARRSDLKLESGCYGTNLLDDNLGIMEIKVSRSMPLWLSSLLSENEIFSQSISKYGTEYIKFLQKGENYV